MSGNDLSALYQQLILDHSKAPQGQGDTAALALSSHQVNPTCGDEVTVGIELESDRISTLRWEGQGCAISQASASLMSELIEGSTIADARALTDEFRTVLRSRGALELDEERFGDAVALSGVSRYIARVKCAMLPWVALEGALVSDT